MTFNQKQVDQFVNGYIEALYFTDVHEDSDIPMDAVLSDETIRDIKEDCEIFLNEYASLLNRAIECEGYDMVQAGRDYWFTRNRHGVGFWDRSELPDELGEALTQASQTRPEVDTYLGDDGNIWF